MKGYRTIIVNAIAAVIPALEVVGMVANIPEIKGIIPNEWMPWYSAGVAVLNVYLRYITTTPVGKKL